MEDRVDYKNNRVPWSANPAGRRGVQQPQQCGDQVRELVIFLRPVVIKEASLSGDYSGLRICCRTVSSSGAPRGAGLFNVPGRQPENP